LGNIEKSLGNIGPDLTNLVLTLNATFSETMFLKITDFPAEKTAYFFEWALIMFLRVDVTPSPCKPMSKVAKEAVIADAQKIVCSKGFMVVGKVWVSQILVERASITVEMSHVLRVIINKMMDFFLNVMFGFSGLCAFCSYYYGYCCSYV
jgi:hypothetical protein